MDELPPNIDENSSIEISDQQGEEEEKSVNKDVQELRLFWENFINAKDENLRVRILIILLGFSFVD